MRLEEFTKCCLADAQYEIKDLNQNGDPLFIFDNWRNIPDNLLSKKVYYVEPAIKMLNKTNNTMFAGIPTCYFRITLWEN